MALTHDLIFDVVLPPLLFEAALNLHWSELKRDLVRDRALDVRRRAQRRIVAGGLSTGWDGRSNRRSCSAR